MEKPLPTERVIIDPRGACSSTKQIFYVEKNHFPLKMMTSNRRLHNKELFRYLQAQLCTAQYANEAFNLMVTPWI